MDNLLELQKDALSEVLDYSGNLIKAAKLLVSELRTERKPDTEELFDLVIKGINWEIEIYNNCENLINKDNEAIDKQKMVNAVGRLGKVIEEKDDIKIAACLDVDFIPFLKAMEYAGLTIGK